MPEEPTEEVDVDEDPVETATEAAENMHSALDQMKRMATQSAIELETMAEYAESSEDIDASADELQEAAATIRRIYDRIEYGDANLVKQ